jgi:hypothetical protein
MGAGLPAMGGPVLFVGSVIPSRRDTRPRDVGNDPVYVYVYDPDPESSSRTLSSSALEL